MVRYTDDSTPFPRPFPIRTFEEVIWLQSPPWARWAAALAIAAVAIWIEVGPEPTVPHPFAAVNIEAGDVVDEANTEMRPIPAGTLAPVELGQTTRSSISSGDPVLASVLGEGGQGAPDGWWRLEIAVPRGARDGDAARIVLLDDDEVAEGVVVEESSEDPLGSGMGLVAVEPGQAAEVARAAGEGRAVVMIAPP
ncbi:MAG TPA: hypothetical protein VF083_14430 [Acidimicrobiia bacterium]